MSDAVFRAAEQVNIAELPHITDHCYEHDFSTVAAEDHEAACLCLRSMIVQAASDYRVGMARQKGAHGPPWFDAACQEKRRALREAVQTGQPVHACEFVRG
eukprot:1148341-Pelagomonas_calceolata.AAC.2